MQVPKLRYMWVPLHVGKVESRTRKRKPPQVPKQWLGIVYIDMEISLFLYSMTSY